MKHPNAALLEKIYADFARRDVNAALAPCAENITFQVAGKSRVAGKFDRKTLVPGFITPMMEMSAGTFKLEVHDILASDQHAVVLATASLTRDGKAVQYRTSYVWRFEGGKPVAWYEYPRDLYQYDALWS